MRAFSIMLGALFASVSFYAVAQSAPDLTPWFLHATSYNLSSKATPMKQPDFIGGKTFSAADCPQAKNDNAPQFNGVWQLVKYDRPHNIAYATATTDQCSASIFVAPPMHFSVPNADLSQYGTGRGLRIGSSYQDVLRIYGGGPPARAGRFVAAYTATAYGHAVKIGHPLEPLPEQITIVVNNGRVSAISIYIDAAALY